jgi:hypothetical protein
MAVIRPELLQLGSSCKFQQRTTDAVWGVQGVRFTAITASTNPLEETKRGKTMKQLFLAVIFMSLTPGGVNPQSHTQESVDSRAEILG